MRFCNNTTFHLTDNSILILCIFSLKDFTKGSSKSIFAMTISSWWIHCYTMLVCQDLYQRKVGTQSCGNLWHQIADTKSCNLL